MPPAPRFASWSGQCNGRHRVAERINRHSFMSPGYGKGSIHAIFKYAKNLKFISRPGNEFDNERIK
jgi:hypothetical protein